MNECMMIYVCSVTSLSEVSQPEGSKLRILPSFQVVFDLPKQLTLLISQAQTNSFSKPVYLTVHRAQRQIMIQSQKSDKTTKGDQYVNMWSQDLQCWSSSKRTNQDKNDDKSNGCKEPWLDVGSVGVMTQIEIAETIQLPCSQ